MYMRSVPARFFIATCLWSVSSRRYITSMIRSDNRPILVRRTEVGKMSNSRFVPCLFPISANHTDYCLLPWSDVIVICNQHSLAISSYLVQLQLHSYHHLMKITLPFPVCLANALDKDRRYSTFPMMYKRLANLQARSLLQRGFSCAESSQL